MSAFRDRFPEIADAAQVLGVSTDTLETQKKFAESLKTPFPLLADADGTVAKAYGVWNDAGYASRVTFAIDLGQIVVRDAAPPLSHPLLERLPLTLQHVLGHGQPPSRPALHPADAGAIQHPCLLLRPPGPRFASPAGT